MSAYGAKPLILKPPVLSYHSRPDSHSPLIPKLLSHAYESTGLSHPYTRLVTAPIMPKGVTDESHANQVCQVCKSRKKRCDKALPSCGYCLLKGLDCEYATHPPSHLVTATKNTQACSSSCGSLFSDIAPPLASTEPSSFAVSLYIQVHNLIRSTGQFVDDISALYFHGFHNHLPIISRTRFYEKMITLGSAPSPDFSILLLTLCLVTLPLEPGNKDTAHERATSAGTLRLAARSLFSQISGTFSSTVHLVQAGIWLAIYEYGQSRPDDAFSLITYCARMGYQIKLHQSISPSAQSSPTRKTASITDAYRSSKASEEINTWWGIMIWERTFYCDAAVFDQPLVTLIPGSDARLPAEAESLDCEGLIAGELPRNLTISSLSSPDVGGFGRVAQGAFLLDQVFKAVPTKSIDSRLVELDALDMSLQTFLAVVMQQCHEQLGGHFCGAIALAIRALFILHNYILSQTQRDVTAKFKSLEDWQDSSRAALETVTKMVVDIADSHETISACILDSLPPIYLYIARAALNDLQGRRVTRKTDVSIRNAERRLKSSLMQRSHRWNSSS